MIDKSDIKAKIRKSNRIKRKELAYNRKAELDSQIIKNLLALPEYKSAELILVYSPYPDEIDLSAFFEYAEDDNKMLAFPRCFGNDLRFAQVSADKLSIGSYGLLEPEETAEYISEFPKSTLAVLPCISATRDGARLGYGKGYYDRFLDGKDIKTVAAIYSFLLSSKDFSEEHDKNADIILTESETIRP